MKLGIIAYCNENKKKSVRIRSCDRSIQICRYFQHAHLIPTVGVGKERRILVGPWWPAKAAPVTGITLRFTGPVLADSRQ